MKLYDDDNNEKNEPKEKDKKEITDMMKRAGTIPYLAMTSHGLSHTQFWPEVEDGLKNAFSSGKNPGYKKK